ncbi:MAG: cation:proton antiporter [Campylobacterales bacterium]|nr:cation:proton antiporter [Campylobacterales bacterium]
MNNILLVIIITIAIATLLNVLLKKIEMPTIIGYIISGTIIVSLFHFSESSKEQLGHLAEFGIVFLMFTIGLEFSFRHLKNMKKEVFLYGALEVFGAGSIFSAIAHYVFDLNVKTAIAIGFALALSSTAIVLKVLNENKEIHSGYGRITLGILLFQDLAVIPILLFISIITSDSSESLDNLLIQLLISAAVVFFVFFIAGKYLIERFFQWTLGANSEEIFLVAVFLIVIGFSFFVEEIGFTYSLGAFLAGMVLAETRYRYRIEADLAPFRDILLGVFFVTIGMQIDWHSFLTYGHIILGLLVGIIIIKSLIIYLSIRFFIQRRTAIKTTLALFQVGEFALVVLSLAFNKGLIEDWTNQVLVITVVLSMIITPFILKNIKRIADYAFIPPQNLQKEFELVGEQFKNHVIICGYGPVGQMVAKDLKEKNILYIILEHDAGLVQNAINEGESAVFLANASQKSVLEHFNVGDSLAVIVAIDNERQRWLICENIASFGSHINTIVKVNNRQEEAIIRSLGVKHIINGRMVIADMLAQRAITCSIE